MFHCLVDCMVSEGSLSSLIFIPLFMPLSPLTAFSIFSWSLIFSNLIISLWCVHMCMYIHVHACVFILFVVCGSLICKLTGFTIFGKISVLICSNTLPPLLFPFWVSNSISVVLLNYPLVTEILIISVFISSVFMLHCSILSTGQWSSVHFHFSLLFFHCVFYCFQLSDLLFFSVQFALSPF